MRLIADLEIQVIIIPSSYLPQSLESPDLMKRLVADLTTEEKHLVHLELMIMEQGSIDHSCIMFRSVTTFLQVADWELDIGKVEARYERP